MKLIIAGSRTLEPSVEFLKACLSEAGIISEVQEIVSGMAKGVDTSAINLTKLYYDSSYFGMRIQDKLKEFPADWEKHGKKAGILRNTEMANYADALLLIWDGESRGSANMKEQMNKLGKPVYEVILRKYNV